MSTPQLFQDVNLSFSKMSMMSTPHLFQAVNLSLSKLIASFIQSCQLQLFKMATLKLFQMDNHIYS